MPRTSATLSTVTESFFATMETELLDRHPLHHPRPGQVRLQTNVIVSTLQSKSHETRSRRPDDGMSAER
jgi:hypothetical protein